MLSDFAERKDICFDYISQSKNSAFSKWLTHAFGQKMPSFLYLDLIKIRLEIMLSEFAMKN